MMINLTFFQTFLPVFYLWLNSLKLYTYRLSTALIQSFVQTKKNRDNVPTVRIPILRYTYICSRFSPVQIPTNYTRYELELHKEELNYRET